MKITKQWLKKRSACPQGFRWFCKTFPNGLDTENDEELKMWVDGDYGFDHEPGNWIVDLTMVLLCNRSTFDECRDEIYDPSRLQRQMYNYITISISEPRMYLDMWSALRSISMDRRRKCLQQVARAVNK